MLKRIIGWPLYIIGYPFHKISVFLNRYIEMITYLSMLPCILFLAYQVGQFIFGESYKTDDLMTTIFGFIFVAIIWLPCAALCFSVYSFLVWFFLTLLYTSISILELLYTFGGWLLDKNRYSKKNNAKKMRDIIRNRWKVFKNIKGKNNRKNFNDNAGQYGNSGENFERQNYSYQNKGSNSKINLEVEEAMRLFHLKGNFDLSTLKKIRNDMAKKYHPDSGYIGDEMAQKINRAYNILKPYAKKT